MLDADANQQTIQGAAGGRAAVVTERRTTAARKRGELMGSPRPAALAVNQGAVKGDTKTTGDGEVAVVLYRRTERFIKGTIAIEELFVVRHLDARPETFSFDAEDPIALLII